MSLIEELRSIVGNESGFLHKSAFGKFVGGVVGGVVKAVPGIGTAITTVQSGIRAIRGQEKEIGRQIKFPGATVGPSLGERFPSIVETGRGGPRVRPRPIVGPPVFVHPQDQGPCLPPLIRGPEGRCIAPTSPLGARVLVGEATMGRYGAALIPGSQIVDRATCLRGMQLGNDGLCYNKGQISNKQRMWPAGRRPLLTGGQMNAISIAARAAKRLEVTTKRLQRMGMMKKAAPRRAAPRGHVARLEHASEH